MAAPIKMDELLVSWLGSDDVYENVLSLIEKYKYQRKQQQDALTPPGSPKRSDEKELETSSPRAVVIPPFYPLKTATGGIIKRRRQLPRQSETWDPLPNAATPTSVEDQPDDEQEDQAALCVRDQVMNMLDELDITPTGNVVTFSMDSFVRITKEVCRFPSFFNGPLYQRILDLWNDSRGKSITAITLPVFEWFWKTEMEPFDPPERFFRLVKQPDQDCILRDDFLPYIKALLNDHPVSISFHRFDQCSGFLSYIFVVLLGSGVFV